MRKKKEHVVEPHALNSTSNQKGGDGTLASVLLDNQQNLRVKF